MEQGLVGEQRHAFALAVKGRHAAAQAIPAAGADRHEARLTGARYQRFVYVPGVEGQDRVALVQVCEPLWEAGEARPGAASDGINLHGNDARRGVAEGDRRGGERDAVIPAVVGGHPAGDHVALGEGGGVELAPADALKDLAVDDPGDDLAPAFVVGIRPALGRAHQGVGFRRARGLQADAVDAREGVLEGDTPRGRRRRLDLAIKGGDSATQDLPRVRGSRRVGLVDRLWDEDLVDEPGDAVAREGAVIGIGDQPPLEGVVDGVRVAVGALDAGEVREASALGRGQGAAGEARRRVADEHVGFGGDALSFLAVGDRDRATAHELPLVEVLPGQGRALFSGDDLSVHAPLIEDADGIAVRVLGFGGLAGQHRRLARLCGSEQGRHQGRRGVADDQLVGDGRGSFGGPVEARDLAAQGLPAREQTTRQCL